MVLWLSPQLCQDEALKVPPECLEALYTCGTSPLCLVAELCELQEKYNKLRAEKGTRCKPWTRFPALVADEAECKQRTSPQSPRLVGTFQSWLAERSVVSQHMPHLFFW